MNNESPKRYQSSLAGAMVHFSHPFAATSRARMRTRCNMVEDRRLLTSRSSPLRVVRLGGCDRVMDSHNDIFPGGGLLSGETVVWIVG